MVLTAYVSDYFAIAFVTHFGIVAYKVYEIKCPNCNKRFIKNSLFMPKRCRHCEYELY